MVIVFLTFACENSLKYKQLEAIMRRIDSQYPDYHYFVEKHALAAAGIAGENEVFYFFTRACYTTSDFA